MSAQVKPCERKQKRCIGNDANGEDSVKIGNNTVPS